ncbi:MAG: ATP-dependent helicase, partial [Acidobacteria bacterium]|nr:ATP-dependent helicase [Acidobacteriota bacterium]
MDAVSLSLSLTPHGRLVVTHDAGAAGLESALAERLLKAFERGSGHGLLLLGADEAGTALPPAHSYWREFGAHYLTALCTQPDSDAAGKRVSVAAPPDEELERLALTAPPMMGAEYLTSSVLEALWQELDAAFGVELSESKCGVQDFLRRRNPAWNLVGRVYFNVAENRKDSDAPFAFLATYTTRLSAQAKAQHLPLGQALREYAGAANKQRLLSLLVPVQRASETCPWLKAMVDAGEIFHPLRWTPREALQLLRDVPPLEAAGVVVRMPAAWRGNRTPRPRVTGTVGAKAPSGLGQNALLDFRMEVTLDGEPLTSAEIRDLLAQTDGLALVRGRWIELDRERLQGMIERFREVERTAKDKGLAFGEAMRLLAGADVAAEDPDAAAHADWAQVAAGPWLAETLKGLRSPQGLAEVDPGDTLQGVLRPYQQAGVRWLYLLTKLGLGACLADDMGLGKTIQVLALLLVLKRQDSARPRPSLLVAPASLLANWAAEIERFTPGLKALVAHPSAVPAAELKTLETARLRDVDLVITSYGSLLRVPWMAEVPWRLAVLDEAQAIKNPEAKQTRAVKKLQAGARLALTGTPVENRLGDLWSIFDFVNPGLLGSAKEFASFAKRLGDRPHGSYGPLRELVRPYILRRLKTDKTVIADLPDKTEIKAFCPLSRRQAALYEQAVKELAEQLAEATGIRRKGLVLSFL